MSRVFRDSKITGQILFIKKIVTARQSVPCRQPVGLLPEARRPGTMPSTPCSRSCNTWGLGGNSRRASPGHGCAFVSCLHLLLYVLSDPRRQGVLKRRVFGQLLCAFRQQLLRDGDALRHTFATRCIELGVDVKTLSEILGHANVSTTLNTYVHSSMERKREQLEKLFVESY